MWNWKVVYWNSFKFRLKLEKLNMSDQTEPKVEGADSTQDTAVKDAHSPADTKPKEDENDVKYGDEEEEKEKISNKSNLKTGNEDEDPIWIQKAKVYRFRDEKWKERGNGYCKLLRHKESKKIRFLLRTEKTKKVSANFYGKKIWVDKVNVNV